MIFFQEKEKEENIWRREILGKGEHLFLQRDRDRDINFTKYAKYAKYAKEAKYAKYAKYTNYVKYTKYAKYAEYADWLKQLTPGSVVPLAMFFYLIPKTCIVGLQRIFDCGPQGSDTREVCSPPMLKHNIIS